MPLLYNAETSKDNIFRGSYFTELFAKNIFLCKIKKNTILKLKITRKLNFWCIIEELHFFKAFLNKMARLFARFIP